MRMRVVFFTVVWVVVVGWFGATKAVYAADHYLSPSGSDTSGCSGGTSSAPWLTWTKAEACLQAGETLYLKSGTYTSTNFPRIITFRGQSGLPISIKAAPGASRPFINRDLVAYGNHGVISGLEISNSSYPTLEVYASNLVVEQNRIHGSPNNDCVHIHGETSPTNVVVVGNEIYNCGGSEIKEAIDSTGGVDLVIRDNIVHDVAAGFQVKGGSRNVIIERNVMYNLIRPGQALAVYGGVMGAVNGASNPAHGNPAMHDPAVSIENRYQAKNVVVRNNLFYNVSGYVLFSAQGWEDYYYYNNTVYNFTGSYLFEAQSGTWEFFDSTALAASGSACTDYTGSLPCKKVTLTTKNGGLANNVVHTFSGRVVAIRTNNATGFGMDHNLWYAPGLGSSTAAKYLYLGTDYSLQGFQALGFESGTLMSNPQLVNPSNTNPNLSLTSSSPAINAGRTLSQVPEDFLRVLRPQGVGYDIGAYEYGGLSAPTATPTVAPGLTLTPIATSTQGPTPTPLSGQVVERLVVNDVSNRADWSVQSNVQVGNQQYGDRTYSLTSVPESLRGSEWIRTAGDSKAYIGSPLATLTVKQVAVVYVGVTRFLASPPSWLAAGGWQAVNLQLVNDETFAGPNTFELYAKIVNPGEQVEIGSLGDTNQLPVTMIIKPRAQGWSWWLRSWGGNVWDWWADGKFNSLDWTNAIR